MRQHRTFRTVSRMLPVAARHVAFTGGCAVMGADHDEDHHEGPLDPRLKLFETRVDSSMKCKPGVYEKMLSLDAYKARYAHSCCFRAHRTLRIGQTRDAQGPQIAFFLRLLCCSKS